MKLYNTLTRKIEELQPLHPPKVTYYTCGPTVYDYTHVGHIRAFVNNDILRRTLEYIGYQVNHVMNITDVGHLSDDADEGEDKMEKGAKKYGKTVWQVAEEYTKFFFKTIDAVNVKRPNTVCKATEHVKDMIALIEILQRKGYTYKTKEAVYFDTAKFAHYGRLTNQKQHTKLQGAREEVYIDPQKKHPADFALWFKRVGRFANHTMHWQSSWGDGFPGWHIECSAMSMKYLGETIDIHAGGADLIPVHHENEIAQSEAATGKPFVHIWFHNEFLMVDGKKMSKSLGNFYTIDDIEKKGIDPVSLRLLFLQVHYRQPINFTWESARGAHESYQKLKEYVRILKKQTERTSLSEEKLAKIDEYRLRFNNAITNDLQTPQAVAIMWEMLKSNIPSQDKLDLLHEFDQVFGLKLNEVVETTIPQEITNFAKKRQEARKRNDFTTADIIRKQIEEKGFEVKDEKEGFSIKKK